MKFDINARLISKNIYQVTIKFDGMLVYCEVLDQKELNTLSESLTENAEYFSRYYQ